MSNNNPQISILIPHYRTPELTKFCLRSLRKYSDLSRIEVIVIDNGSRDASTQYLRSLSWIRLVEREPEPGERGGQAHARALDLGLTQATAPLVLSIHTDTIITSPQWLDYLLAQIEADAEVAAVGSWKLEFKPWYKLLAKKIDPLWDSIRRPFRKPGSRKSDSYRYLRSHCALYRTEIVRKHRLSFGENEVVGKAMHRKLEGLGYEMKFLDIYELVKHLRHINHATMILNPEIGGSGCKTGTKAERRRVLQELKELNYEAILADTGLDR